MFSSKAWIYVALTSIFELIWLYGFNVVDSLIGWFFIIIFVILDLNFLAKACKYLPTGTIYAIFAAVGTVGTVLMDIFLFQEGVSLIMMVCIAMILIGVVGLNLFDAPNEEESYND